jgi:hypothetical protein
MLRQLRQLSLAKYKGQEVTIIEPALFIKNKEGNTEYILLKDISITPIELFKIMKRYN